MSVVRSVLRFVVRLSIFPFGEFGRVVSEARFAARSFTREFLLPGWAGTSRRDNGYREQRKVTKIHEFGGAAADKEVVVRD